MKTRFTIDLSVFNLILKELRAIKKELRERKGVKTTSKPLPPRELARQEFHRSKQPKELMLGGTTIITEDTGASRIVGWDNAGLRIIIVVTQGGD